MAKCRHLSISDEAYQNGKPAAVFLCCWQSKLGIVPAWIDRLIGGGVIIDHKTECSRCPCFEKEEGR